MATVTFECKKSKQNKEGEAPIYLRINVGNKRGYHSTGIFIKPSRWNQRKRKVRKSTKKNDDSDEINAALHDKKNQILAELKKLVTNSQPVTIRALKKPLGEKDRTPENSFISYSRKKNELIENSSYNYFKKRKTTINHFEDFAGKNIAFSELSPALAEEFYYYLREDVGNSKNTAKKCIEILRGFYNEAIERGIVTTVNPFRMKLKDEPRHKIRLTEAEFNELQQLKTLSKSCALARDVFLWQVYTAGMRFQDCCLVTWGDVDDHRITYQMKKSKKIRSWARNPSINELLAKYYPSDLPESEGPGRVTNSDQAEGKSEKAKGRGVHLEPETLNLKPIFPLLKKRPDQYKNDKTLSRAINSRNVIINKDLKKVATKAGIKKRLSTHVARHTFSEMARKNNWSVYDISKALGHSDLKTTQVYLSDLDQDSLDGKMKELFG